MIKKLFITIIILFITAFILLRYFVYVDLSYSCNINIIPSMELSNRNIIRSLITLKNASASDYKKVCDNVQFINSNVACGGFDGGCYKTGARNTIYVSTSQRDLVTTTMILVHETCHLLQEKENRVMTEQECYKKGDDFLKLVTKY